MKKNVYVILLAGGSGTRMGSSVNKVLLPVAGKPCIVRSAEAFLGVAGRVILVCRAEDMDALRCAVSTYCPELTVSCVPGGKTRQQSVANGLAVLPDEDAYVLVHDGARCLVSKDVISRVLDDLDRFGSGVASLPVTDTVKRTDPDGFVAETIPRASLRFMQTPQGFLLRDLKQAHHVAERDRFEGTDDASLMEYAGFRVHLSEGSRLNLKLTTREDLAMAESIIRSDDSYPMFRVGQGYDVHRFSEDRKLILCGVEVPHTHGLLGHSDADVALHALMDALLGAAGLRDIGHHFPDNDPQYKGISSMILLERVMDDLRKNGFLPANVDVTIVAQQPKLSSYIPQMSENIANALGIPPDRVNVKATTTEHLGFEGRKEGISAQAVCLIREIPRDAAE